MTRLRLRLGHTGLDFDRDYGTERRTGWTAVHRGSCLYPYFTTLPRAVFLLVRAIFVRGRP